MDSLGLSPDIIPCNPPLDTFELTNFLGSVEEFSYIDHLDPYDWSFTAHGDSRDIRFRFSKNPTPGIYVTTMATQFSGGGNYVNVTIATSIGDFPLDEKSNVYVRQIDASTLEITICSAPADDGDFALTTRLRCLK